MMKIRGQVVSGKKIGRTLGFPTANIECFPEYRPEIWPENGVYAGLISFDGRHFPCVFNQGIHPTLPEGNATVEAFLFDFDGDLYQKEVELEYLCFLRPEKKFESLDALKKQIAQDTARAKAFFENMS